MESDTPSAAWFIETIGCSLTAMFGDRLAQRLG
jgi:hypothetical protein